MGSTNPSLLHNEIALGTHNGHHIKDKHDHLALPDGSRLGLGVYLQHYVPAGFPPGQHCQMKQFGSGYTLVALCASWFSTRLALPDGSGLGLGVYLQHCVPTGSPPGQHCQMEAGWVSVYTCSIVCQLSTVIWVNDGSIICQMFYHLGYYCHNRLLKTKKFLPFSRANPPEYNLGKHCGLECSFTPLPKVTSCRFTHQMQSV